MEKKRVAAWLTLILLFPCLPLQAQVNVNKIAILHWYAANHTTSFPVGSGPAGLALDGLASG